MAKVGSIHGEGRRKEWTPGGDGPAQASARRLDIQKPWSPPALLDEFVIRRLRNREPLSAVLPKMNARSMRLALYRGLAASGLGELDGLGTSVEWARAMLVYSGLGLFEEAGYLRNMRVFDGYPGLIEFAMNSLGRGVGGHVFRIYARALQTADDMVASARLFASHRGYITETDGGLSHFRDITGIFITEPGVRPKRVGIAGYEHYVDFRLPPAAQVFKIKGEPAFLIPGPPRPSREEIAEAREVIAGRGRVHRGISDVVELARTFGSVPPFSIPIKVLGRGKLSGPPSLIPGPTINIFKAGGLGAARLPSLQA